MKNIRLREWELSFIILSEDDVAFFKIDFNFQIT